MQKIYGGNSERRSRPLVSADTSGHDEPGIRSRQEVHGGSRQSIGSMLKPVCAICHMQEYVTVGHEYEEANGRH